MRRKWENIHGNKQLTMDRIHACGCVCVSAPFVCLCMCLFHICNQAEYKNRGFLHTFRQICLTCGHAISCSVASHSSEYSPVCMCLLCSFTHSCFVLCLGILLCRASIHLQAVCLYHQPFASPGSMYKLSHNRLLTLANYCILIYICIISVKIKCSHHS